MDSTSTTRATAAASAVSAVVKPEPAVSTAASTATTRVRPSCPPMARTSQLGRRSGAAPDAVHRVVVMVGDGRNQAECRGNGVRYVAAGGQHQDRAVFGGPEERRDEPVERALERPGDGESRDDHVHQGAHGQPGRRGGEQRRGDDGGAPANAQERQGREAAGRAPEHGGDGLGERPGVGEVGQGPGGAVGAPALRVSERSTPARRGVAGGEGAADEQGVEDDPGGGQRR